MKSQCCLRKDDGLQVINSYVYFEITWKKFFIRSRLLQEDEILLYLLENRVTIQYLVFKLSISFYLLASYIISHVESALGPVKCVTNRNDESETGNSIPKTEIVKTDSVTSDFICPQSEWPYYGIYFTNWSWTLMCISFWLETTLVCLRYNAERKQVHQTKGESNIIPNHKSNLYRMKCEPQKGKFYNNWKPHYLP